MEYGYVILKKSDVVAGNVSQQCYNFWKFLSSY